jgi:hypothetical protein
MSSAIQNVHDAVCQVMLEPNGFTLGLVTEEQFLQLYVETITEFLGRSGLFKGIAVIPQQYGIGIYTLPDWMLGPEAAFTDGLAIGRDPESQLAAVDQRWQSRVGTPRSWRQDKLLQNQAAIFPAPTVENDNLPQPGNYGIVAAWVPGGNLSEIQAFIGTMVQANQTATFTSPGVVFANLTGNTLNQFSRGNLSILGILGLFSADVALGNPVESLTDDWVHFLKYGILKRIFDSDSECRDVMRARYCETRFEEGIALARAIMGDMVEAYS